MSHALRSANDPKRTSLRGSGYATAANNDLSSTRQAIICSDSLRASKHQINCERCGNYHRV